MTDFGGLSLPGYTVVRELGRGGSGTVVVARAEATQTLIALKLLSGSLASNPGFREQFRAEARVLESLRHPNIAAFYWYHEGPGSPAIAMELVDGVPLRALIGRGPTGPEAALSVLRGSLVALDHLHRLGLVHRDYKPGNVIVDRLGESRLVDFGIAVRSGESGELAGTPSYAAPEQWAGGAASPGTDVYAATTVLVECLRGAPAFGTVDPGTLRELHLRGPLPVEGVPEAIRDLVLRGMAKDPARRYPGAAAFLEELERSAAKAYGSDWRQRGAATLAVGVVAMAALLPLGAAAAGGAGATGGGGAVGSAVAGGGASAAAPSPAAPARVARQASRLRSASGALSAAVGAVAATAVVVGVMAVAHRGPFTVTPPGLTPAVAALQTDFGGIRGGLPSPDSPPGSAGVAGNVVQVANDGHLVQTVLVGAPADVPLRFSFCDAFVCGTSDNFDCIGNLEIPQFGGSVPLTLEVAPPPGSHLQKLLTVAGGAPGALTDVGYFDAAAGSEWNHNTLAAAPATAADGTLQLRLSSPIAAEIAAHTRRGQLCGFTREEATAFVKKHGAVLHNATTALVRVVIDWSPPSSSAGGTAQTITFNGTTTKQPLRLASVPSATSTPQPQRQDDARWTSTRAGTAEFGRVGTVPTTVSMLLSGFSIAVDPPKVGMELIAAGAWTPGKGTNWTALAAYVAAKKLSAAEVDLAGALDTLSGGGEVMVATTVSGAGRESTALVTGYDAQTDTFSVLDPLQGAIRVSWDDLLGANPWFLAVSRPAAAQ